MREWLKKYDVLLRVICFLVAVMLWLYVVSLDNPEITTEYKNVGVTLAGVAELLEEQGLSILEGLDAKVNVRVKARMDVIYQIGSADNIVVTADVSTIKSAGTHQLAYTTALPSRNAEVVSTLPTYISVTADKIITTHVPVQVSVEGGPAEGYAYGECIVSADRVTVEGPDSVLSEVTTARVRVDAQQLKETTSWNCSYTLVDAAGNEVASEHIVKQDQTVSVTLPVTMVKQVPLTVDWIAAPGIDPIYASAVITPPSVNVTGSASALETVNQISLGAIDLSQVTSGETQTHLVILPNGVLGINAPETADVTITLNGVETRDYTVTDIQLPSAGEEVRLTLRTQQLTVAVRGHHSVLDLIGAEDIVLTVQSDPSLWMDEDGAVIPGEYELPVRAQVAENAAAVVGEYQVLVEVSAL